MTASLAWAALCADVFDDSTRSIVDKTTRDARQELYQQLLSSKLEDLVRKAINYKLETYVRQLIAVDVCELMMQNGEYNPKLENGRTLCDAKQELFQQLFTSNLEDLVQKAIDYGIEPYVRQIIAFDICEYNPELELENDAFFEPVLSVPPSPSGMTDTDKDSLDRELDRALDRDSECAYDSYDISNPRYAPANEDAEPVKIKLIPAKSANAAHPQQTPSKKLEKPKATSWADISEEDDRLREEQAASKKKLDGLSWSLRVKLANVPAEQLDAKIAAEELRLKQIEEKNRADDAAAAKALAEQESKAAKEAAAKAEHFARFRWFPPAKPAVKISNDDVKALLEKQKRDLEDAKDGFVKVVGKQRRQLLPEKVSNNKYRDREKTTTSAKWFCFPENPIMSEADDWNLWDYTYDQYGRVKPIGWVQVGTNKFKINHKSPFSFCRYEDGSWGIEEDVYDDKGAMKYVPVTRAYFRWILTPAPMRRGPYPDE